MKKILLKILLLGGFLLSPSFISTTFASEVLIAEDVFLFKVGGTVFGRRDLLAYYNASKLFDCAKRASLVNFYFDSLFSDKKSSLFKHESLSISAQEKAYYSDFLPFLKILMYSKSFDQSIDKAALVKSLDKSNCHGKKRKTGSGKREFFELASLNSFLESRFLPQTSGYKAISNDLVKARSGVQNLINSILKQIDQEVYW
jgi:hypothetical protein